MALDNRLTVYNEQGNPVDYDILASDVKFLPDGKDLPTKLAEMQQGIDDAGQVNEIVMNGQHYTPTNKAIDLGTVITQHQDISGKVDKEQGKGLSTNDFTAALKEKLEGLDPYTKAQVDALIAAASSGAVSVTTNGDGTFTIHVGSDTYTINLNHNHPNMAKLIVCEEGDLPSTLGDDTIYAITDSGETEIEKLIIRGMEFAGGGGSADDGLPKMATPKDESTINLGSIEEGETTTKDIPVRAKNLNYGGSTTGLTVEAVGAGLKLQYGQALDATSVTIPQVDAMIGVQLRITFTGSSSLNGELRFKQGSSLLASVVVVAEVETDYYSGIVYGKRTTLSGGSSPTETIEDDDTKCITPTYDLGDGSHVIKIRFGYTAPLLGLNGYGSSDNFIEQWSASANERTVTLYNNVTKVKATLQQADLDNCYIYDVTAAKWLFKGNNVTQIPT